MLGVVCGIACGCGDENGDVEVQRGQGYRYRDIGGGKRIKRFEGSDDSLKVVCDELTALR